MKSMPGKWSALGNPVPEGVCVCVHTYFVFELSHVIACCVHLSATRENHICVFVKLIILSHKKQNPVSANTFL